MIFSLKQFEQGINRHGEEYRQDVLAVGRVEDRHVVMSDEDYAVLRRKWSLIDAAKRPMRFVTISLSQLASEETMKRRDIACESCSWRAPSQKEPGEHYCRGCGCGDVPRALLSRKRRKLKGYCPAGREEWNDAAS